MLEPVSPLAQLLEALASGATSPRAIAEQALARANGNASRNTYLQLDRTTLLEQAEALAPGPLHGVPISLKDCFGLKGTVTTCGSAFYASTLAAAPEDSAMALALRTSGALITGKTHLHPLAYGITGQNPDYGDCLQPRDPTLLTGGSSSGAAASIQEGSALAAIGTDTGGSIRVPAALCGLAGYRASHALAGRHSPSLWTGAAHLAPSFDTPGFLLKDPRDLAPIANALFGVPLAQPPTSPRIAFLELDFLTDASPDVLNGYALWRDELAPTSTFSANWWSDSRNIFAAIQASEAALLHRDHYNQFEPAIAQRLHWGASITPAALEQHHLHLAAFRAQMAQLFAEFDFLVMPCAPVALLVAHEDQQTTRAAILRYTTPFSLAGLPVVTLPTEILNGPFGTGIQVAAAAGEDASLLAFAAAIAQRIASR